LRHSEPGTRCGDDCHDACVLLQAAEAAGQQGALPLQPDYLLLDGAGRRHVIPARLALASGQDWWVPRSRVDLCVLTDALNFAMQSQLWLLSNSPRPHVRRSPSPRVVPPGLYSGRYMFACADLLMQRRAQAPVAVRY